MIEHPLKFQFQGELLVLSREGQDGVVKWLTLNLTGLLTHWDRQAALRELITRVVAVFGEK